MGDVARCSLGGPDDFYNEDILYKIFGKNAELLIDHAWGFEPCRISDIKSYTPQERSVSNGQVLHKPYTFDETRLNVREMADELSMTLFEKEAVTDQLVLYIGYDAVNTENGFSGEIHINHYGKTVPAGARGSLNLGLYTNSSKIIVSSALKLYDSIADKNLLSRRIYIVANHAKSESEVMAEKKDEQLSFFVDYDKKSREEKELGNFLEKEKKQQSALLSIQKKFGKNSIFKASDLEENATAIERNNQIGGHASGENSETQSDDVRWAALKETSEKRESMKKNAELFSGKSIDFSCGSGYDDMIYLSPHKSAARPKMSLHDRAAQFSPFDALKGFDEAVRETSKLTKSKVIHSSDMDEETNESLVKIAENIDSHPEVEVKYFSSDESKSGGDYMIKKGFVKKIDALSGKMIFEDGGNVKINDIDFVEILNKEGRA